MKRWAGGFRARVFLLIGAVAVVAAGATAFLTVRQATQQVTDSAAGNQNQIDTIVSAITQSGGLRTDWGNLSTTLDTLSRKTGQRIRATTLTGALLVDTDTIHGGQPRSVSRQGTIPIDPRPSIDLSKTTGDVSVKMTINEVDSYQFSFRVAQCLASHGVAAPQQPDSYGVPSVDLGQAQKDQLLADCSNYQSKMTGYPASQATALVLNAADKCPEMTPGAAITPELPTATSHQAPTGTPIPPPRFAGPSNACLESVFRQVAPIQSPPLISVSIGVGDAPLAKPITLWPALAAAAGVAVVAIFGTILLSRRVLRPIGTITGASRRLAAGDLSERVPVRGHDELSVLATSFNSMAESLQASKEQQRNMVADIAHELRTPLANIRGYLEALKDGVIKPDTALFVSLYDEAVLQQRLIDDLQDLAQAESGTMIYHRARLDVAELLNTCRTAHATAADGRGVGLEVYVYQRPAVDGDPDRLRQVIGNLITNALRATPLGGSVKLRAVTDGDDVVIEVADTGRGIEPDDLAHVFDRFWRADNARSRSTGGSGLGLAIAREIVGAHDGSLTVASEVGVGTVCTIRLPALD